MDPATASTILATEILEWYSATRRNLDALESFFGLASSAQLRHDIQRLGDAARAQRSQIEPLLTKVGILPCEPEPSDRIGGLAQIIVANRVSPGETDAAIAAALINAARREVYSRAMLMTWGECFKEHDAGAELMQLLTSPSMSPNDQLEEIEVTYGAMLGGLPGDPVIKPRRRRLTPSPHQPEPSPPPDEPSRPIRPGPTIEPTPTEREIR